MKRLMMLLVLMLGWGTVRAAPPAAEVPRYHPLITIERGYIWHGWDFPERFSFSPDGSQLAAAASDTTVNIWDVQTGAVVRTLAYDVTSATPLAVAWSPDGALIATGSIYGGTRVWDAASGALRYAPDSGYGVAWSPDGTRFATEYRDIHDAQSGALLFHIESLYGGCQAYWSPDGALLATTSCHDSDYFTIWSLEDRALFDTYWGGRFAAWSPDSTRIASDMQVREVATGLAVTVIPDMGGAIAWHPGGKWIASTGDGHQISLWDAATGERLAAWVLAGCEVTSFAWSPDGNRFAANCVQSQPSNVNKLVVWERES